MADTTTVDPIIQNLTLAIVNEFGLQDVYQAYLDKNYSKAEQLWLNSNAYKNLGPTAIANRETKVSQPGYYNDVVVGKQWLPALRQYATDAGLSITDASLSEIADKALSMGMSVTSQYVKDFFKPTIKGLDGKAISNPYVTGISGGTAAKTLENLNGYIKDYGVGFNSDWVNAAAKSVGSGATTEQYWLDQIKNQAIGAYPGLADQINAGMSVRQAASPYIQTMSNILGLDPLLVNLNDNLLKVGLQGPGTTSATGQATPGNKPMTIWEFEQTVRKDPRWATSKDAMDTLSNVGYSLARQWGLVG